MRKTSDGDRTAVATIPPRAQSSSTESLCHGELGANGRRLAALALGRMQVSP